MQVKKYEAPSMKEALEMIKTELGPDAVILSVKDNNAGFGLMGKKSIEVSAAVSERKLQMKTWAESRLNQSERDRLQKATARAQKQFIEKSVNRYLHHKPSPKDMSFVEPKKTHDMTRMRYIDIEDGSENKLGHRVEDMLLKLRQEPVVQSDTTAQSRVKMAAREAYRAFEESDSKQNTHVAQPEVDILKAEINNLRKLVYDLKNKSNQSPWTKAIDLPAEFKEAYDKLLKTGLNEAIVLSLLTSAHKQLRPEQYKTSFIEAWIVRQLLTDVRVVEQTQTAPIQVFIGPRGHGKTSHLVKLASLAVIKENKRVAIFSADQNKVGAVEQLKIYSQILNIPFGLIQSQQDWEAIKQSMYNFDLIFVDFPGSSIKNTEEMMNLRRLLPPVYLAQDIHLVLSVCSKDDDAYEFADRYKFCNYKDVVFTFLDESVNHGLIYNLSRTYDVPLHSFGVGSKIPEDFEFATRERVIDLLFKISKIKSGSSL